MFSIELECKPEQKDLIIAELWELGCAGITELSDTPKFADIKSIAYSAVNQFETGVYDEIYICYNQFVNAITVREDISPQLRQKILHDNPRAFYAL